jgi:hypothetical protein
MNRKLLVEVIELESSALATPRAGAFGPIKAAAELLAEGGVAVLRIFPKTPVKQVAITRADSALRAITSALVENHDLPSEAYVELDEESYGTPVAPFKQKRFLLPHQDGGHCSFLTPSRLDYQELTAGERVFSTSVYFKRPSHKLYQGFLITNPGAPPGCTYYYSSLALLWDAFCYRHSRVPISLYELAEFNVQNARRSMANQSIHGSRYLTFGAMLGSSQLEHHVMPSGPRAESELWPGQYARLPKLCEMTDQCPCGLCEGPGERLLCHACLHTLGKTWPQVHFEYEASVVGELHDLLIGNNLTQLHAADSNISRTILPMCIVTVNAGGDAYERWIGRQWRQWYALVQSEERVALIV